MFSVRHTLQGSFGSTCRQISSEENTQFVAGTSKKSTLNLCCPKALVHVLGTVLLKMEILRTMYEGCLAWCCRSHLRCEIYLPYFLCIDNNLTLHSYNEGKGTIYQTAFAVRLPLIYPSLFMKSIFTVEIRLL